MLYNWIITVPKNTPRTAPVEQKLTLAIGIVTWYSVLFPPGCVGLVHAKIYHREHQIVPSKGDQDLAGDTFPIEWNDYYELYERPADFLARCWNEDDTYPHKVHIRIAVVPRRAVAVIGIADAIKAALGLLSPKRIFTRT
ncbi:hypothetical protein ES703_100637 [subsurface metagenome]